MWWKRCEWNVRQLRALRIMAQEVHCHPEEVSPYRLDVWGSSDGVERFLYLDFFGKGFQLSKADLQKMMEAGLLSPILGSFCRKVFLRRCRRCRISALEKKLFRVAEDTSAVSGDRAVWLCPKCMFEVCYCDRSPTEKVFDEMNMFLNAAWTIRKGR